MRRRSALAALTLAMAPLPATAGCTAANLYTYSFATAPAATLSYTGTSTYTATNANGQSLAFTVSFAANGLNSNQVNGVNLPAINTQFNDGGTTNRNLVIGGTFSGRTTTITGTTRVIATTLTFATQVRDLSIQINDIDFTSNQFRDWVHVSGVGAGTYVPSIITPFGTSNSAGAKTNAGSSLALGAATTPFVQTANEAIGTGAADNNATTGTLTASFAQPVTAATVRYGNYPLQAGETVTGQQGMGIQTVTFCPMPTVALTKTSAPFSDPQNGTTNPKLIPGGDAAYSLTISNTGGSDLDINGVLADDTLPAQVSFYNGNFSATVTGPFELTTTGGATVTGGSVSYSNNGTTFAYTPAAGYDSNVRAFRLNGTGTVPPGGTIRVRFRTRIN